MLSPWFDRSSDQVFYCDICTDSRPQALLILAPPRSGSFHLARLLWQLGYGKPTEYFNRNSLYRTLLSRWGRRPRWQRLLLRWRGDAVWVQKSWLKRLVEERSTRSSLSTTAFFSSKLQPFQLPGSFAQAWPRLQRYLKEAGCTAPDNKSLLLLLRRDWRAAVASYHLSRCSGAYDLSIVPTFQHRPLTDLLKPEALIETAALYRQHLQWLLEATIVAQPLVIHHEDLVANQVDILWRLLQHCDPGLSNLSGPDQLHEAKRSALAVSIARDSSPWVEQRSAWLERIHQLLTQLIDQGAIGLAHDTQLLAWVAGDLSPEPKRAL